jgi:hypothetical protein
MPKIPLYLAALAVLLVPEPTRAVPILLPGEVTYCDEFGGPGSVSKTACNATVSNSAPGVYAFSASTKAFEGYSGPNITAKATAVGTSAEAQVTDIYYLAVVDRLPLPSFVTTVPLVLTGTYNLVNGGFGSTVATLVVTNVLSGAIAGPAPESGDAGFGSYTVTTNAGLYPTIYQVKMFVEANAAGSVSNSAFLDPFFYIDPSFAYADDVSLVFSSGINNIAPSSITPLPAALPLFATGLGAMGLFGWRRKRKAQAAD